MPPNSIKSKHAYKFTIIIPSYNEEKGIGCTLDQIMQLDKKHQYETIVVDDGSSDNTASIAERYNVKVIKHTHNRGYGAALKTGIKNARHKIICITDADGTYPNELIPQLVDELVRDKQDMVVGTRTGEKVAIPKSRRFAKRALTKLGNWIVGERIPDLNSGLRVFTKESINNFFNVLPDGFSFTTTITLGMLVNGYKVKYIPINYHPRKGKSKIKPIRDTLNFIQLILRIGLYFAPLKVFLSFSAILFILALLWGFFSAFVLGKFADASTLTIVMSSIQVAVIGLLAELINHRTENYHRRDD